MFGLHYFQVLLGVIVACCKPPLEKLGSLISLSYLFLSVHIKTPKIFPSIGLVQHKEVCSASIVFPENVSPLLVGLVKNTVNFSQKLTFLKVLEVEQ